MGRYYTQPYHHTQTLHHKTTNNASQLPIHFHQTTTLSKLHMVMLCTYIHTYIHYTLNHAPRHIYRLPITRGMAVDTTPSHRQPKHTSKQAERPTWLTMRDANMVLPSTMTVPPPENLFINGTFRLNATHTRTNKEEEQQENRDANRDEREGTHTTPH